MLLCYYSDISWSGVWMYNLIDFNNVCNENIYLKDVYNMMSWAKSVSSEDTLPSFFTF